LISLPDGRQGEGMFKIVKEREGMVKQSANSDCGNVLHDIFLIIPKLYNL
jgi:hypothetical protein